MGNETLYYDTLKHVAKGYVTLGQLERNAEQNGLEYVEALEMAYDNIINTCAKAIKGKRRPKSKDGARDV